MSRQSQHPAASPAEIGPADVRPSSTPRGDAAMARYAAGDAGAFSALYDEVGPRLLGYLLRKTGNRLLAEDLLQQTFLQMHRARGSFAPGAQVMPWAIAIARRLVIDEYRRSRRREGWTGGDVPDVPDPAAESGYQRVSTAQISARLEQELGRLPVTQRQAFELMRLDGLTLVEAAAASGTTVPALKSRSHRAYESLRAAFAAALGD